MVKEPSEVIGLLFAEGSVAVIDSVVEEESLMDESVDASLDADEAAAELSVIDVRGVDDASNAAFVAPLQKINSVLLAVKYLMAILLI